MIKIDLVNCFSEIFHFNQHFKTIGKMHQYGCVKSRMKSNIYLSQAVQQLKNSEDNYKPGHKINNKERTNLMKLKSKRGEMFSGTDGSL